MKRIFISYTLKGTDMIKDNLIEIKRKLKLCGIDTYIDILDTKFSIEKNYFLSKIELNKKNITNKYQKNLMKEILNSRFLCLLDSESIDFSEWVKEELIFAKQNNIPIIKIKKSDWKDLIKCNKEEELRNLKIVKELFLFTRKS